MKVTVNRADFKSVACETLVVGIWQGEGKKGFDRFLDEATGGAISRFLKKEEKFGKPFDSAIFHVIPAKHKTIEKVVIVGFGKEKGLDAYKLRQIGGFIGKTCGKGTSSLAVTLPSGVDVALYGDVLVIGILGGTFDPGHRKTEIENGKLRIENLEILTDEDLKKVKDGVEKGLVISQTIDKVREVVNLPANIVTPKYMADFAKKVATNNKLKIEIFSEEQVKNMGMEIMASVARGSEEDLYFVVLEYLPKGATKTLVLVGKGITFDSGGISIKPSEAMEWMKMDMAGAASVFGAVEIIAKLNPKINVIAACPMTENLPSGRASKPGDVVRGIAGKTVEIINTDAEGRLVLADALSYVGRNFKPDWIVDVATLTGASIAALGNLASAILGNDQKFIKTIVASADKAGERLWQLPLYEEYREQLKSYIADIANVSATRGGGTETGAKFLEEFVPKGIPWAHLDIAPTAWEENDKPYAAKGASGTMVATLVNLAVKLAE